MVFMGRRLRILRCELHGRASWIAQDFESCG
jgi:hypothetical protein